MNGYGDGSRGEITLGYYKCSNSDLYYSISASHWSKFIVGLFLMLLARVAYLRVLRVSPKELSLGDMVAIIRVLLLPPSESYRRRVSVESRYGM